MADPCDLQRNCPQGYLDKTGFMYLLARLAMQILNGGASNPSVTITKNPQDVPFQTDNPTGLLIAAADPDRVVGWIQNLSSYTVWVSHSPTPVPDETTRVGPGGVYQFGEGWTTAQPLYAIHDTPLIDGGGPGTTARVIVGEGVPA